MGIAPVDAGFPRNMQDGDGSLIECQWTITTANPSGVGIKIPEWMDATWHFKGTIGTAHASVQTAPTDTDADYATCKNAAGGAAIDISAGLPVAVTPIERSIYTRPSLTTPGSGATVVAHVSLRRHNPMRQ